MELALPMEQLHTHTLAVATKASGIYWTRHSYHALSAVSTRKFLVLQFQSIFLIILFNKFLLHFCFSFKNLEVNNVDLFHNSLFLNDCGNSWYWASHPLRYGKTSCQNILILGGIFKINYDLFLLGWPNLGLATLSVVTKTKPSTNGPSHGGYLSLVFLTYNMVWKVTKNILSTKETTSCTCTKL